MICPRDGKTRMTDGFDYINHCPQCGAERYASRRCINDMVRDWDNGVFDWSRPLEELFQQTSPGFYGIIERVWHKVRKEHPELNITSSK